MADFTRQWTGLSIIKSVCGQIGVPVPNTVISDPTNVLARQMWYLLNSAGRRTLKPHNGYRWNVLKRTWTLVTVPGQTVYDLPVDFDSFIDSTVYEQMSAGPMAHGSDSNGCC